MALPDRSRRTGGRDSADRQASGAHRGFGSLRVEATIKGVSWRTSIFPQKSGGYILPIKADVRRRAGVAAGDEVSVSLELC